MVPYCSGEGSSDWGSIWRHLRHGVVGAWSSGCVAQWVGSLQISNYQINDDLIRIIQFCLKIYLLWRDPQLWIGVYVVGWMAVYMHGLCEITNYLINLNLIEKIQIWLMDGLFF